MTNSSVSSKPMNLLLASASDPSQENAMPPTTQFDLSYPPKMWRCDECRTILGVVMRDTRRIRRLWIFRVDRVDETMPSVEEMQSIPRGMFRVHGTNSCDGVECSHCGAINEWSMSQESYLALISRYQKAV